MPLRDNLQKLGEGHKSTQVPTPMHIGDSDDGFIKLPNVIRHSEPFLHPHKLLESQSRLFKSRHFGPLGSALSVRGPRCPRGPEHEMWIAPSFPLLCPASGPLFVCAGTVDRTCLGFPPSMRPKPYYLQCISVSSRAFDFSFLLPPPRTCNPIAKRPDFLSHPFFSCFAACPAVHSFLLCHSAATTLNGPFLVTSNPILASPCSLISPLALDPPPASFRQVTRLSLCLSTHRDLTATCNEPSVCSESSFSSTSCLTDLTLSLLVTPLFQLPSFAQASRRHLEPFLEFQ